MSTRSLMFSRHTFLNFLTIGLLFCLQASHAQAEGKINLRFVSFPKSAEPVKVQLRVAEDKVIDIEAHSNWLSVPVSVNPLGAWMIGETLDGPDGKPVFKELGRAKALASSSQLILLVRKGRKYADGFDVLPVDNRGTNFGGGKFLFFNAARIDIAGEVGSEKFVIKPSRHVIIKPKTLPGERSFQTVFWFRKDDEAKPFFSSRWPSSEDARSLIFFYHQPGTEYLRFHTIRDFP